MAGEASPQCRPGSTDISEHCRNPGLQRFRLHFFSERHQSCNTYDRFDLVWRWHVGTRSLSDGAILRPRARFRRRAESSDLGQMYSFDGRISAAVDARTGGLLQAVTYVAGRMYLHIDFGI